MSPDERDDPGADTAMFRAYVEEGAQPAVAPPQTARWMIPAAVVAVILIVLVLALVL